MSPMQFLFWSLICCHQQNFYTKPNSTPKNIHDHSKSVNTWSLISGMPHLKTVTPRKTSILYPRHTLDPFNSSETVDSVSRFTCVLSYFQISKSSRQKLIQITQPAPPLTSPVALTDSTTSLAPAAILVLTTPTLPH